jgi:hypothetical protein
MEALMASGWLQDVAEGIKRKLRELQEILDTPIVPDGALVPIPIRPQGPARPAARPPRD